MKDKFKNIVVLRAKEAVFTPKELALIARKFQPNARLRCKGALQKLLSPSQFSECWRIRELQVKRHDNPFRYDEPLKRGRGWDCNGLKRAAWKTAMVWSTAWSLRFDYFRHLADPIQKTWKYRSNVKYSVSLRHSRTEVKYESSRPACSYEVLCVTLTFDLLRHRWQWIGGMLTISAKTDEGKKDYPCWWFQQRKGGVGLEVKTGWIINRHYHVSAVHSADEARRKKASIIRRAKEKAAADEAIVQQHAQQRVQEATLRSVLNYKAPKGWVNRLTSIIAGNCEGGTDNFIASRVAPFFQKAGFIVGDLRGISIRVKTLFEIERSAQTRRVAQFAK